MSSRSRRCRAILKEPYAATIIDAVTDRDALRSAKEWAAVVEGTDASWLEVRHNGKCIKIFEPGEL
jgi:hypothetical protein